MGQRSRIRLGKEFDVSELVEILNSDEQTSSSGFAFPAPPPASEKPQSRSYNARTRSSIENDEKPMADRRGRTWGAHAGYSFSPPERDPPKERAGSGTEGVEEQWEAFRSLTESDELVRQLRTERRAWKDSGGRARRRRDKSRWAENAGDAAVREPTRKLAVDPSSSVSHQDGWADAAQAPALSADDPFLRAIALEDSLLLGEDGGTAFDIVDMGYLDSIVGGGADRKGAEQAGSRLEPEWQSLAALLERSLVGLGPGWGVHGILTESEWMRQAGPKPGESEMIRGLEQRVGVLPPRQGPEGHGVDPFAKRVVEGAEDRGKIGERAELGAHTMHSSERAATVEGKELKQVLAKSSAAMISPIKCQAINSEREEGGGVDEKQVHNEQAGTGGGRANNGAGETREWRRERAERSGGDVQIGMEGTGERGLHVEESVGCSVQKVDATAGEMQRLLAHAQALEAAVSEKAQEAASLAVRLEQQQAEHARAVRSLKAEFEAEKAALRNQAKSEAGAAVAALEKRVAAAEWARQEGAARGEEQERLLKEARRREARLQETNKALLQRIKIQKAESEAAARTLEAAQAAAKDSAGLLESTRREAKALRARLDELAEEREAEKVGGERAREAGARLRRELTEAKAAAKACEAAQLRSQAEVAALRKRLSEAESAVEQERSQRESVQAEHAECNIRVLQLTKELETLQARLGVQSADESHGLTCQPADGCRGVFRNREQGLAGRDVQTVARGAPSDQDADEDSLSFLTPSPDTSPDKHEGGGGRRPGGALTAKLRSEGAGALAARNIAFAEPLMSNEATAETSIPSQKGHTAVVESGGQAAAILSHESVRHQSLSSSDSSLDGPPRPWAWAPVGSKSLQASKATDPAHKQTTKWDGPRKWKGDDISILPSGEAQSRFYDLKEAYLRVLQTKGLRGVA